ncbi:hypothetical protein F2Q68_00009091 [Brassica cretica]|uniref:Uncharacterized protein n=1 Tax=Brassica cretica TaxID=69181 RepID=A0A8S9KQD2_BRACR|nr:hypothetical protein F2Q68_00009091 [Brassica cretica]
MCIFPAASTLRYFSFILERLQRFLDEVPRLRGHQASSLGHLVSISRIINLASKPSPKSPFDIFITR